MAIPSERKGNDRAANEPHSPIAFIGPAGPAGYVSPILLSVMSFAIAEYDRKGKDILLVTDRRWVCGTIGNYIVQSDDSLKSIDLNSEAAIAFTGRAKIMACVISKLYDDPPLFSEPYIDVLKRLEAKPHKLALSSHEIVGRLDRIIPDALAFCGIDLGCSVILAGKFNQELVMYWWAKKNEWKGTPNRYSQHCRVRTLPSEATRGSALQKQTDQILDGHGKPAARIRRVVEFLSNHEDVRSVGGGCVMRRCSKGFIRPQRNRRRIT